MPVLAQDRQATAIGPNCGKTPRSSRRVGVPPLPPDDSTDGSTRVVTDDAFTVQTMTFGPLPLGLAPVRGHVPVPQPRTIPTGSPYARCTACMAASQSARFTSVSRRFGRPVARPTLFLDAIAVEGVNRSKAARACRQAAPRCPAYCARCCPPAPRPDAPWGWVPRLLPLGFCAAPQRARGTYPRRRRCGARARPAPPCAPLEDRPARPGPSCGGPGQPQPAGFLFDGRPSC
jgi:hypothetical protein